MDLLYGGVNSIIQKQEKLNAAFLVPLYGMDQAIPLQDIHHWFTTTRHQRKAKNCQWKLSIELQQKFLNLPNRCKIFGKSLYNPIYFYCDFVKISPYGLKPESYTLFPAREFLNHIVTIWTDQNFCYSLIFYISLVQ